MEILKFVLRIECIFTFLGFCFFTIVSEKSARVMFLLTLAGVPLALSACIFEFWLDKKGKVSMSLFGRTVIRYCLWP